MQKPARPFESLEWYRRARQGQNDEHPWLSLARSFDAVRVHLNVLAVGSVALLAINLLRTPERVWADTAIAVWGLVFVMHLVVAGIVTLVLQLLADDDDVRPASEVRWDPMRTWTAPLPNGSIGPNGVAVPEPAESPASPPSPAEEARPDPPAATGWRVEEPDSPRPAPGGERASWKEAADAAWLARGTSSGQDEPGSGELPFPDPRPTDGRTGDAPGDADTQAR